MTGEVVSLTERRLSRAGIKILFFKSIVKQICIENHFPGGTDAFCQHYGNAMVKAGLIAVTFMSIAQMDEFVQQMKSHGLLAGRDLATANQMHGVVIPCAGIEFVPCERPVNKGATATFPIWFAQGSPD